MQTTTAPHIKGATHLPGDDRLFLAGHKAPIGLYRLVGTAQEVRLDQEDDLPATLDGRVAVYERRIPTWAEWQSEQKRQSEQKSDSN